MEIFNLFPPPPPPPKKKKLVLVVNILSESRNACDSRDFSFSLCANKNFLLWMVQWSDGRVVVYGWGDGTVYLLKYHLISSWSCSSSLQYGHTAG